MSSSEEVFLALCRPGFESDLAAELTDRCAELGASGYPRATDDSGYVLWNNLQGDPDALLETGLIFGRSFYPLTAAFEDLPEQDRIGALWPELERQGPFAELFLEHADTNASRELARFLRGFRKALEPRLRKAGLLRDRADRRLHLFFEDSRNGRVGVSPLAVPLPEGGLTRLRLAPEAP
ncbi:MAG TPA: 23S rRNA (cytidine(2498)-2'-O)-methyltransferase RlmM, partial [Alcanivorax sp.]|nr:23S rRNA (cytidine(2498)-2'-O)-methyltransferase RlmM [Alcanivorax sp.]